MKFLEPDFDPQEVAHLRCIVVPSGIGEFQWAFTKYSNVVGERFAFFGLDGAPRRLHQFVQLHPQVEAFGYLGFDYTQIREFQKYHKIETWADVQTFDRGAFVMLACNPHLEAGRPLADWMPDLPTSYSYEVKLGENEKKAAERVLYECDPDDVLIGISCASYRGASAWKTWGEAEWKTYLGRIQTLLPKAKFVMLGGSWDDLTSAVFDPDSSLRFQTDRRGLPPIGTLTFGGATALLRKLDGYIGFSSGLGHVAAHLCDLPVFMLWPEHEQLLSHSWVNPYLLDTGMYVPSRWLAPEVVFKATRPWLNRVLERKYERRCRRNAGDNESASVGSHL